MKIWFTVFAYTAMLFCLGFVLFGPTLEAQKNKNYIEDVLKTNHISTLEQWDKWLNANVQYSMDDPDVKQPWHTLVDHKGRCIDLALLNGMVVQHFGLEPIILAVATKDPEHLNHAVLVFAKDGELWLYDNLLLQDTHFTKVEQFNKVYKKVEVLTEAELKGIGR